jgi:hypothetical protein
MIFTYDQVAFPMPSYASVSYFCRAFFDAYHISYAATLIIDALTAIAVGFTLPEAFYQLFFECPTP